MRFGTCGCRRTTVRCEFCSRRATGLVPGDQPGTRYRICGLCYGLIKRAAGNPWPRNTKDHTNRRHMKEASA